MSACVPAGRATKSRCQGHEVRQSEQGRQDSWRLRRASSLSGERRRSAQGGASALAAEADGGTPNSASAETFPRSFKIQRASSADSLASLVRPPSAYSLSPCCEGPECEVFSGTALDCNIQGSSSAVGSEYGLAGICNASVSIAL